MIVNFFEQWHSPVPNMHIDPYNIHVWKASLKDLLCNLDTFSKTLSDEEIKRSTKFKFDIDRNNFIISRGILRTILSNYLSIEPSNVEISYLQYGKPYLRQSSIPIHFNISHSNDLVLYVFSSQFEVGIDIEKITHVDNYMEIAENYFTKNEVLKLNTISKNERLASFFKCWTRKEAYVKALGCGLNLDLNRFEVSLLPLEEPKILSINNQQDLASTWSLYSLSTLQNFEAALAFQGKCNDIKLLHFQGLKN